MVTRLAIHAGEHPRSQCPVSATITPGGMTPARMVVRDEESGEVVPCQTRARGNRVEVSWILSDLPAGQSRLLVLENATGEEDTDGVKLVAEEGRTDVMVDGELFTSFHTAETWARPFLHPVIGPYGDPLTRAYPIVEGVEGETQDHPHHKSIWVAWGEVNGVDNWSENKERGHGTQRVTGGVSRTAGPVYGRMRCAVDWLSEKGDPMLAEDRDIVIWNLPASGRMIDLTVTLKADRGPVRFGDTKEGGFCSVRVASSMDASGNGSIYNAFGGINEKETWGKRAHWCDYVGPVNGKTVGMAVFDHPQSLGHPTYWHVRNYGLMTANPFGLSFFHGDRTLDGSYRLESGGRLTFRYRIYCHRGTGAEADVAGKYHDFINPPVIEDI